MPEKDPLSYTLLTYAWVFALSLFGGCVGYLRKVKAGIISRFSIHELLGELLISAFVGVITFYLCEYAQLPGPLSAAFIGISAHMGSRAIFIFETAADRAFARFTTTGKL
ncbi:LydA family holin superfamily III [Methylobacter tundripaludum]|uniref:LydA family holin superfamily III n=2 Tax=Methylobacter tundripaludum TaxID=173365 RepID=A0A2S6H5B0_9GAMM|nr:LydA family holin superfamily III [Methylobacter tundripaludum]